MITIHFSPVEALPEASLQARGPVSEAFISRGIETFHQAANHLKQLPYGINNSSDNAMIVFEDGYGTCLTKHGLIARLAQELGLAVYRCDGSYQLTDEIVTGVGMILAEYDLRYIPRTHCFLTYESQYVDLTEGNCTGKNGLIETYLEIVQVKPEQSIVERDEAILSYYAEACQTNTEFARIGIDGMLEVLERCAALNMALCQQQNVG